MTPRLLRPRPAASILLAGSEFHGSSRWDRAAFVSLRLAYFPQPNVPGVPPRGSASEQPSLSRPTGVAVRASRTRSFQRRAPAPPPPPGVARSASGASPRSEPSLAAPPTGLSSRQRSRSCRTRAAFSGLFWMVPRPQRRGPRLPRLPRLRVGAAPGFSPAGWVSRLVPLSQPVSQDGHAAVNHTHVPGFPWFPLVPFSVPGPQPGRHCPLVVMAS